jgi:hypothetical protein
MGRPGVSLPPHRWGYPRARRAHWGPALLGLFVVGAIAVALGTPQRAQAGQLRGVVLTPSAQGSQVGLTTPELDREVRATCAVGSTVARMVIDWSKFEPDAGQVDPRYVAAVDRIVGSLAHCGIPTVITILGTPCWTSTDPGGCTAETWRYPPRSTAAYGDVVAWSLARWGSALAALEVWNEPNTPDFWLGSVQQYVALVNEAAARAHAAGSRVPILAGALAGTDFGYLGEMYAAGLQGPGGISIHPYSLRVAGEGSGFFGPNASPAHRALFRVRIAGIHRTMLANGDPSPVWLTEFGYPVCPAVPFCVSAAQQSKWIAESLRVASRLRYVHAALIYSLRDTAISTDWHARFGLMNLDFSPRPSYFAVRRTFNELSG